jgi:6-pyruvoyltetrahydropterin/6-carboxytetrahydropterin synthase
MARYSLGVLRSFTSRHRLVGGDFGPEGELHGHAYRAEVRLEGDELDEHGFLVNILRVEEALDGLVARYRDAILNELPEFEGSNTGVEVFARVFVEAMSASLEGERLSAIEVRLWESDAAWASCRRET